MSLRARLLLELVIDVKSNKAWQAALPPGARTHQMAPCGTPLRPRKSRDEYISTARLCCTRRHLPVCLSVDNSTRVHTPWLLPSTLT